MILEGLFISHPGKLLPVRAEGFQATVQFWKIWAKLLIESAKPGLFGNQCTMAIIDVKAPGMKIHTVKHSQ